MPNRKKELYGDDQAAIDAERARAKEEAAAMMRLPAPGAVVVNLKADEQ